MVYNMECGFFNTIGGIILSAGVFVAVASSLVLICINFLMDDD